MSRNITLIAQMTSTHHPFGRIVKCFEMSVYSKHCDVLNTLLNSDFMYSYKTQYTL